MHFLERLADYIGDERWLVQSNGTTRVAWVIREDRDNPGWLSRTCELTREWIGPIHPRVAVLHTCKLDSDRLLLEVDDDRGPTLFEAAEQLADPVERERWSVAQIIGIADAIVALRARDTSYVSPLDERRIFIDHAGHACLRAPVRDAARPASTRAGPGPAGFVRHFLSPEQARGERVGAASNVFSLASCLYEAIAGRPAFPGDSIITRLIAVLQTTPARIDEITAPWFRHLLSRAFVKDPAQRIPDVAAFAAELRRLVPDAADYDAVISDRIVAWRAAR